MSDFAEALARYRHLIKGAEDLEKMAGPETYGGPTYWQNMRECTAHGIAHHGIGDGPKTTWSMSSQQMMAIGQVASDHLPALWLAASKNLRARAAEMLTELECERTELDETIGRIVEADVAPVIK